MKNYLKLLKNNSILLMWYCGVFGFLVVLSFCITFVVQNNCREIYENNFIDNKELPMGNKSERLVYLTLQLFCNPKGSSAYKLFSDMQNGNLIVNESANASFTAVQSILVNNNFTLQKSSDFTSCYFKVLPFFKTTESAFSYLSMVYLARFNSVKFISYKSFKSSLYV